MLQTTLAAAGSSGAKVVKTVTTTSPRADGAGEGEAGEATAVAQRIQTQFFAGALPLFLSGSSTLPVFLSSSRCTTEMYQRNLVLEYNCVAGLPRVVLTRNHPTYPTKLAR